MLSPTAPLVARYPVLASLLVVLVCAPAAGAAISSGGSVSVDILIHNPDRIPVKSWTLDLAFDPAVLDASAFLAESYVPLPVMNAVNLDKEADGVDPDIAKVGVLNVSGSFGTAVDGVLGTVTFDGVGYGATPIFIATTGPGIESVLLDTSGADIPGVQFGSTSVEVVPEPTVLGLLAAGTFALIRRRS